MYKFCNFFTNDYLYVSINLYLAIFLSFTCIHMSERNWFWKDSPCPTTVWCRRRVWSNPENNRFPTHMLHVWNIYLHDWVIFRAHIGKYSSTMVRIWAMKHPKMSYKKHFLHLQIPTVCCFLTGSATAVISGAFAVVSDVRRRSWNPFGRGGFLQHLVILDTFKSKLKGFIMIYRDLPGKMVISEISGYLKVLHVQNHVLVVWS